MIGAEGSRLLREQHESEDPAEVVFLEEGEAVPAARRHCESGVLEQMSHLSCDKVKATSRSANHGALINIYGIWLCYIGNFTSDTGNSESYIGILKCISTFTIHLGFTVNQQSFGMGFKKRFESKRCSDGQGYWNTASSDETTKEDN
ncbi:hypothetical protein JNUCC1_02788 [Lentibacillus sp. JNUCC-1]|nr:hypothetical protein [Lentibacillus sp. JNUCC-1]